MTTKPPLQHELKAERCKAWQAETEGQNMRILAEQIVSDFKKAEEPEKVQRRFSSYRRDVQPIFPHLEACVEVEKTLKLFKGQIYRAITKSEEDLHRELEKRFGKLPLKFVPTNSQSYDHPETMLQPQTEVQVTEEMTLQEFDYVLNCRGINASQLAKAIGVGKWQRIATLRRRARDGGEMNPLPTDIAGALVRGIKILEGTDTASIPPHDADIPSTPTPKIEGKNVATDALHILGFGGLDISIETRLNLEDLRLEDGKGNILVKDNILCIPPIPLTAAQLAEIRRWIGQSVASKFV